MPEADGLWVFLAATVTLNVTPGPDMMYVIARSVGQGRAAGIVSSLGIAAGCLAHTLAVACGVAGLLIAAPTAGRAITYAGATYLVYLGVRTLRHRGALPSETAVRPERLRAVFLQAALTNLLNPKVALFFLAFLPQFVNRAAGDVAPQVVLLGVLFNISGTLVNVVVALAASRAGARLKDRLKDSVIFRRMVGGIFIGLGLRLALAGRN